MSDHADSTTPSVTDPATRAEELVQKILVTATQLEAMTIELSRITRRNPPANLSKAISDVGRWVQNLMRTRGARQRSNYLEGDQPLFDVEAQPSTSSESLSL